MPEVLIRPATQTDATGMAQVHVFSWQSAYQGLLPAELLANQSIPKRTAQWQQWLSEPGSRQILVLEKREDKTIWGFACGGPERTGNPEYTGEIYAIYLLPEAQGQGWGQQLFRRLQRDLIAAGFPRQLVWVLSQNQAACGFYAHLGGQVILERRVTIGEPPTEVEESAYGYDFTPDTSF